MIFSLEIIILTHCDFRTFQVTAKMLLISNEETDTIAELEK